MECVMEIRPKVASFGGMWYGIPCEFVVAPRRRNSVHSAYQQSVVQSLVRQSVSEHTQFAMVYNDLRSISRMVASSIRTYPEFSISFTTVSRWNLLYGAEAAGWSVFGPTIRPSCVYNDTQYMFLPNTPKDLFQWWLGQLLLVVVSDFG